MSRGKTSPVSNTTANADLVLEPQDNERLRNLCGELDEHLRQIERRLGIEISNRGNAFHLIGSSDAVEIGQQLLRDLFEAAGRETLTPARIHLALQESGLDGLPDSSVSDDDSGQVIRTRRGLVRARGANQQDYVQRIMRYDMNFGIGPAGTGKTYLAVACAVDALERERTRRILLVRPAVEAGERLGFLPGDLTQKIDPYLRPLYDALYEMLGFERVNKLVERNVIEVAPLAYMRGRSLNEAFVILDEAQNTTPEQMKMFLTRIGFGSTAVCTGDITQIDLPRGQVSGLRHAAEVLANVEGISFTFFNAADVVRHALVQKVVQAYGAHEEEHGS